MTGWINTCGSRVFILIELILPGLRPLGRQKAVVHSTVGKGPLVVLL